jgi:hypothetical protein
MQLLTGFLSLAHGGTLSGLHLLPEALARLPLQKFFRVLRSKLLALPLLPMD